VLTIIKLSNFSKASIVTKAISMSNTIHLLSCHSNSIASIILSGTMVSMTGNVLALRNLLNARYRTHSDNRKSSDIDSMTSRTAAVFSTVDSGVLKI
jgi:hypothetical protein